MIRIMAFVGKAGAGKTTAARFLEENYFYIRLRFADKLKRMMKELGLSNEEIEGNLKFTPCELLGGKTPRHAMQTLGTEWGRDLITPNLWVNALDRQLQKYVKEGCNNFVVDDLRFVNELNYLNSLKGDGCKVVIVGIERNNKENESSHISETQMEEITRDHTIFNYFDLETLHKSIDEVMDMYFYKE